MLSQIEEASSGVSQKAQTRILNRFSSELAQLNTLASMFFQLPLRLKVSVLFPKLIRKQDLRYLF